jgi:hypothetical protein
MGEMKSAFTNLVAKPEEKKVLERHKHRSEDNIKMNLKEIGWI